MSCKVSKVHFYPKKMYRCLCLIHLIDEIYNADIRNYSTILKTITIGKMSPIMLFCTKTDGRTNGIAVCTLDLEQFLLAETKFLCTSQEEGSSYFESLNRCYCKQCIRHYLQKMAEFIHSLLLMNNDRIKFNHFS